MIKSKNNWKKWSVVGFLVSGLLYSGVAYLGHIEAIESLSLAYKLGIGAISAITTASLAACTETLLHRCRRQKEIKERERQQLIVINNNNFIATELALPSYTLIFETVNPQVFNKHLHAKQCNLLVADYLKNKHKVEFDFDFYINKAQELDAIWKKNNLNNSNYLSLLQAYNYSHNAMPTEIIGKIAPARKPFIQPGISLELDAKAENLRLSPPSSIRVAPGL